MGLIRPTGTREEFYQFQRGHDNSGFFKKRTPEKLAKAKFFS